LDTVRRWTQAIVAANTADGGVGGALETVGDRGRSMMAYFTQLIERDAPSPKTTHSHLVAAGVGADGDIAGSYRYWASRSRWSPAETTPPPDAGVRCQLLHQRPDQRRLPPEPRPDLRRRRRVLRLTSPAQALARTVTRDANHRRHHRAGPAAGVLLVYGSETATNANSARMQANSTSPAARANILTFSHGAHHCLGARAECSRGSH